MVRKTELIMMKDQLEETQFCMDIVARVDQLSPNRSTTKSTKLVSLGVDCQSRR